MEIPERLIRSIANSECALFLGAGVSVDSGSPTAQELADRIGNEFLSSQAGEYDLADAAATAEVVGGRKALNEWIAAQFASLEPSESLRTLASIPWKAIYTVNFDTLVEAAYGTEGAARRLRPFYSNRDRLSRLETGEIPLYKLHGCITRANSDEGRLTLTHDDYANVRSNRLRLLNRLVEDLSDFTILYVGFARGDPDFAEIMSSVETFAGDLGLRRSYAVQRHVTEADVQRWEKKRVTLIPGTATDFLAALGAADLAHRSVTAPVKSVRDPLVARFPEASLQLIDDLEKNFEIVDERLNSNRANIDLFFKGAVPSWGTVLESVDARRDVEDSMLAPLLDEPALDRRGAELVTLHAEAGAGKTTLLRRVGVELAFTWDRPVISLKPYAELTTIDVERLVRATNQRVYVLVDNASRLVPDLAHFMRAMRASGTKVSVLAAARTNEWHDALEGYSVAAREIELGLLSRDEIVRIVTTLERNNALDQLTDLSAEQRISQFETRAKKQLLVALREATEGRSFDEIVVDEYQRIPTSEAQRAYLLIAALHQYDMLTRAGLLYRSLQIPLDRLAPDVFEPAEKVIVPIELRGEHETFYSTRHPLIASIVFDRVLSRERDRLDFMLQVVRRLDIGFDSDADVYRQLSRGRNKALMRSFDDRRGRRQLMDALIELDPTDALALQHAAIMELDLGHRDEAGRHLAKAIELKPNDLAIRDTEGRLLLAMAKAEVDPQLARANYERAEALFQRNIERRPDEPFAYKHLADTYSAWSDAAQVSGLDVELENRAYELLLVGLAKCGPHEMLVQALAELERRRGNVGEARALYRKALARNAAALPTRLLAASLEERAGDRAAAIQILKEGLGVSGASPELHYRLALLLAEVDPASESAIRGHFEAAVLGRQQDYRARLAFAAYLFERGHYVESEAEREPFSQLLLTSSERNKPRRFRYGRFLQRHEGSVIRLSQGGAFLAFDRNATSVYWRWRELDDAPDYARPGVPLTFGLGFNLRGGVALDVRPR